MMACPVCRARYPEGTASCPEDGSALLPEEAFVAADAPIGPGAMIGEYRVERKLGEGSFGAVYAGVQPLIGKRVAIKVLHRKMSSEPEIVARFIGEARAVNRIGHRNIIDVFSFGVHEGTQHYFVMELCDGLTLGELIEKEGRIAPQDALPILRGIADGLDAAHRAGVTHRDLKPDNVFLVREKEGYFPKLLDFGVAKLVKEEGDQKTATGVAIGTPRYMSPEQCRGKKVDHRADIYALGVLVHEMLTGKPPFDADSTVDLMFKHATEAPPPMSSVCPDLPDVLDDPVLAMLAKRPSHRPASAGEAIEAFAERLEALGEAPEKAAAPEAPSKSAGDAIVPETIAENASEAEDPALAATGRAPIIVEEARATGTGTTAMPISTTGTVLGEPIPEDVVAAATTGIDEARKTPPPPPPAPVHARKPGAGGRGAYLAGAMAVVVVMGGVYYMSQWGAPPPQANVGAEAKSVEVAAAPPASSVVTLRVAVMPADARILLDGREVGSAADGIEMPREKKQHALRIEKPGYEPQTMWISAEEDREIGPISLAALTPSPSASSPADKAPAPAPKAAPAKKKDNNEIWRPPELGGSR